MLNKNYIALILFLIGWTCGAQDMQEGFNYLENGNFPQAEYFFKEVLSNYPENKTAQICYGRAIGLNGNAIEALAHFNQLLKTYPNDFEIKLNYGEALLWNQQFNNAKTYYEKLINEKPQNFSALLGYANTLSNLKAYQKALNYVNKALVVSPNNNGAITSMKYIYLGYAYQKQQSQKITEAQAILKEGLDQLKNDADLQFDLANLYLIQGDIDNADAIYLAVLQQNKPIENVRSRNGLALTSHLKGKQKAALRISTKAYNSIPILNNPDLIRQTKARYIQTLIWNRKYNAAEDLINVLQTETPNENWILTLKGLLSGYKSNFEESLDYNNQIIANDSLSFDGNMGKAGALKGLGKNAESYAAIIKTLGYFTDQKDALQMLDEFNTKFNNFYDTKIAYAFDNGDNRAMLIRNRLEIPFSTKFKAIANYNYQTTNNNRTNTEAQSHTIQIGTSYQLHRSIKLVETLGQIKVNAFDNAYTHFVADVYIDLKPFPLQTYKLGYSREAERFNAELLNRELLYKNYYITADISSNVNIGWYGQYYYRTQSDGNERNLLFTSLYYNFNYAPIFKMGINYQYMAFKNTVPLIYFSPKQYHAGEVFLNITKTEENTLPKTWFYELTAAVGIQDEEVNNSQTTFRLQGNAGYKFSNRCQIHMFGLKSNIASATSAGFSYTEIGLGFKWYFTKKARLSDLKK